MNVAIKSLGYMADIQLSWNGKTFGAPSSIILVTIWPLGRNTDLAESEGQSNIKVKLKSD